MTPEMLKEVRLLVERAEIKAEGAYQDPPLDLDDIRERSEQLDAKSPHKADIWLLLAEVERLRVRQKH